MKRRLTSTEAAWTRLVGRSARHGRDERLDESLTRDPNVFGPFIG